MAITYGFFDSVNGDRKYNANQMSEFYTGIANDGVFQHIDNGLAVSAGTGLTVNVATGRALIQKKWVKNDAVLTKTISAASATYARIDAVVIRFSKSNRNISIVVKDGTPAASPAAPSLTRNSDVYEMALAYVNVAANATSVTVTDKRSDTTVCGWVSVAQQTSGEVDAMLNAMKTGFDGVVYSSPAAQVIGSDTKINSKVDDVSDVLINDVIIFNDDDAEEQTMTEVQGLYKSDGTIGTYSSWHVHYDVTVSAYQKYKVNAYGQSSFPFIIFFDEDDNIVSIVTTTVTGDYTTSGVVPLNAVKMGINHWKDNGTKQAICYLTDAYSISQELTNINNSIKTIEVVSQSNTPLSLTPAEGYYLTDGTIGFISSSFNHYTVTTDIRKKYRVDSYGTGDARFPMAIFFDASDNVISYIDSEAGFKSHVINVPSNTTKIGFNHYPTSTPSQAFKLYPYDITDTEEYIDNRLSNWKGKKIVWFGTSIPAGVVNAGGSGGSGAYPTRIGQILGATVYNESIGSSRMRGGSYKHISADDPMGFAGIEMIGLMYSFTLSQAEKQDIMDDWDSKWSDIIPDLPAPNNYDPSKASYYKASSWDAILPKYLTGGSVGQCDLYVFDHGYNEGVVTYGFSELSDVPSDTTDRTYFIGAMNYIVKKILEDNPKAKILIIGHYNHEGDQFNRGASWNQKYVCEAQKKYSELWGISCVETWKLLGLSTQTITIGGTTKTIIGFRYPDGLHPASDTTGYELQRYAESLAPYINLYNGKV